MPNIYVYYPNIIINILTACTVGFVIRWLHT